MDVEELLAREGIERLAGQYHMAGDRGDATAYAALYAEDGVLVSMGDALNGRQAIHDYIAGVRSTNYGGARQPTYLHHQLCTHSIEITGPDTARGKAYFTVYTDCGPDHHGTYRDKYVRVNGTWLFAQRKVDTQWFSPDCASGPGKDG